MNHLPTISIDFKLKKMELNGNKIMVQLWDTAGQEKFRGLTKNFFNQSDGIIVCYSVIDQKSFDHVNNWMS